jgi:hypothetical protein
VNRWWGSVMLALSLVLWLFLALGILEWLPTALTARDGLR